MINVQSRTFSKYFECNTEQSGQWRQRLGLTIASAVGAPARCVQSSADTVVPDDYPLKTTIFAI